MQESKIQLRFFLTTVFVFCVFAFSGQSMGPLLADGTVTAQSFQDKLPKVRATPLTRVAACLPAGASCSNDSDCCIPRCTPVHHKCAGR